MRGFLLTVIFFGTFVTVFNLLVPPKDEDRDVARSLPTAVATAPPARTPVTALPSGLLASAASPTPASTPDRQPTPVPVADEPVPTPPVGKAVLRVKIPRLAIDAPIVGLGVLPDGTMDAPATPTDVGWYTFSAKPGEGSNVVMGGHVDYANYGPAVFYQLRNALSGDEVHLQLEDGTTASYRVLNVTLYEEETAPVDEIVGPTDGEMLTLITCGGTFNSQVGEYDKRVVVRAERIVPAADSR